MSRIRLVCSRAGGWLFSGLFCLGALTVLDGLQPRRSLRLMCVGGGEDCSDESRELLCS